MCLASSLNALEIQNSKTQRLVIEMWHLSIFFNKLHSSAVVSVDLL